MFHTLNVKSGKVAIPALFIPNTYEVYWDISVDKLVVRMEWENSRYWKAERKAKALNAHGFK